MPFAAWFGHTIPPVLQEISSSRSYCRELIVMITGGNNGIGLAMVRGLLGRGDHAAALNLEVADLPPDDARLLPLTCDVTDVARVWAAVDQIQARLVGRAGATLSPGGMTAVQLWLSAPMYQQPSPTSTPSHRSSTHSPVPVSHTSGGVQ